MKSLIEFYGIDGGSLVQPKGQEAWASVLHLIANYGGLSVGGGVYRVATKSMADKLQSSILEGFPDVKGSYSVFAYDWLGRTFAFRPASGSNKECILFFEVGAGEVINIPAGIVAFHDAELIEFKDDSLSYKFFEDWRSTHTEVSLGIDECVGYKKPLFLGGKDTVDNLEVSDLDVYVSLMTQLRGKVRKG